MADALEHRRDVRVLAGHLPYQVFITSRMREAYDRSGSTQTAVLQGIGRSGRVVTSAALILGLAFVALIGTPGTENKMFATALAAGILLDATIVRAMLVPAAVAILGRWNWRLPPRPARVLRVAPSLALRDFADGRNLGPLRRHDPATRRGRPRAR